jgi:hypothetical protein
MSISIHKSRIALIFILGIIVVLAGCGAGLSAFTKNVDVRKPPVGEPSYVYVPFDVPAGAEAVVVELNYDVNEGKNRLELGVFDQRFSGKHGDKNGFRGWSGSVRKSFFISREDATHGYEKGELKQGRWYLVLGVAAAEKDSVKTGIKFSFDEIPQDFKKQNGVERATEFKHEKKKDLDGAGWYRGDLHSHTFHSDGRWTVKGVLDSAVANNLDFVSITDHNTFSHHYAIDDLSKDYSNLLILKGAEVTTYGGHINVWGLKTGEWVDFRLVPEKTESAAQVVKEAHEFGGLASANHPTMSCGGCNWTYGDLGQMDSVEIWNATWDKDDEAALRIWDGLLQKGTRITAIGSSDTHLPPYEQSEYPTNLVAGSPTVYVQNTGRLTQENLFKNIKEGRVYVAEDSAKQISFNVFKGTGIGDTVRPDTNGEIRYFVRLNGFAIGSKIRVIAKSKNGTTGRMTREIRESQVEFERNVKMNGEGFIRLEVRNPDGSMAAFTNPIWIVVED